MKISIDTSSFSFRFIGSWLLIISIIIFFFFSEIIGGIIFLISVFMIIQKYKYMIPKKSTDVLEKIDKTLKTLGLEHRKTHSGFSTKTTQIIAKNYGLFTTIHFKFDKVYNIQGKYLAVTVAKYQRYK